jgi:hypothetical protein
MIRQMPAAEPGRKRICGLELARFSSNRTSFGEMAASKYTRRFGESAPPSNIGQDAADESD